MEKYLAVLCFLLISLHMKAVCEERQVYIVYLGEHSGNRNFEEIEEHHHSFLHSVKGSKQEAETCLIHSYKHIINGFSAFLTPEEASTVSEMDRVISVFRSQTRRLRLQTTRSWDFTNLLEANGDLSRVNGEKLLQRASYGKDVIVGVFDSGIWPESRSFNDEGMEPVPKSWKGTCQQGIAFNSSHCNRKIIGARYYLKHYEAELGPVKEKMEFRSPRDKNGHGTHTASTIGGRRVPNASSLGGFANGTASGGAPFVRLAIYKVCWQPDPLNVVVCPDGDTLAAFDDAIKDGVHVISLSIGGNTSFPYAEDGTAIGSLHALKRDIIVVCAAGNSGPTPSSVANVAPWLISVGASSIDRIFQSTIVLGNGLIVQGRTVTPLRKTKKYPLVYAVHVEIPGKTTNLTTGWCFPGTLSKKHVKGKVVFCRVGFISQALEVRRAGGVAAIFGNPYVGKGVYEIPFLLPGTTVLQNDRATIVSYILNNENPTATLFPGRTIIGTGPAPFMAPFTSLGPNGIEPNILKPDITAPGLNILAAWTEASPPTQLHQDHRVVKYNIASGTSMSCPHASAVAALLKAIHPDWSSAAIRSSLMTTARRVNNVQIPITDAVGNIATPFHYGAGHFQPSKAADPGLVYDASYADYLLFLCSSGTAFLDPSFKCPKHVPPPSDLNYPSLAIAKLNGNMTVSRTVTNVGTGNSTYTVSIVPPPGYTVEILPTKLYFSKIGEKQSFSITVKVAASIKETKFEFGWYAWSDGVGHVVSSPIVVSAA
ncbi:subtilisin-like protease SBT5.6 [Coffea arabica]|uniref:Subtilisin-like protease SBT5.6 n=1 Tax=Coffea arabica TaxID=13443 RepID=A0A6P6U922_COFAR